MKEIDLKTLFRSMRPPFLLLTPASIFLGFCTALEAQSPISTVDLVLVLLGAMSAHISVNTFNEYFDFRSGLDTKTSRTPFSGGSGALVDNPSAINGVLYAAIATLAFTALVGLYFVISHGIELLLIGLAGVLIIVTYTDWINRNPIACLLAPGVAFGPLMVVGTFIVLTGEISVNPLFVSLVPLFLVSNLLLLNQFPDIAADKSVGRKHFPIVYGVKTSTYIYGVFVAAACTTVVAGVVLGYLPLLSSITLIPMAAAVIAFRGVLKHATSIENLLPYMGMNVAAALITPVVLGISIVAG